MKKCIIPAALLSCVLASPVHADEEKDMIAFNCAVVSKLVVNGYVNVLQGKADINEYLDIALNHEKVKGHGILPDMVKWYFQQVYSQELKITRNLDEIIQYLGVPTYVQCMNDMPGWLQYLKGRI